MREGGREGERKRERDEIERREEGDGVIEGELKGGPEQGER